MNISWLEFNNFFKVLKMCLELKNKPIDPSAPKLVNPLIIR